MKKVSAPAIQARWLSLSVVDRRTEQAQLWPCAEIRAQRILGRRLRREVQQLSIRRLDESGGPSQERAPRPEGLVQAGRHRQALVQEQPSGRLRDLRSDDPTYALRNLTQVQPGLDLDLTSMKGTHALGMPEPVPV
jgi:hypothetical protein